MQYGELVVSMIYITKMNELTFEEAVNFIARNQSVREHHIGYFGITAEEIRTYITEPEVDWRENTRLAYEGENLVGVIMVDYDAEIKRAWIHGPIVEHHEWQGVADKLFAELITHSIPDSITELELYGESHNLNLKTFAERLGFIRTKPSCVLGFPRKQWGLLPEIEGQAISEEYYDAFQALHAKLFPGTYYTGAQILDMRDHTNAVFIESENQTLLGFIRGKLEEETQQGYIDFVGVKESFRRKGIGKNLVLAILHWLFRSFAQINVVTLTVYETNVPAVKLYTTLGFDRIRSLQGYRKNREGDQTW
jgi:ribosomal protein S18 acetylase RimI-like enzyme